MRPLPRLTVTLLCVACGILGYIVLRQHAELARVQNNERQELTALQAELGAAKQALAKSNNKRPAARLDASEEGAVKGPAKQVVRKPVQISDVIKDHPEFAKLYRKFTRRELSTLYGDGLNALNLPPPQLNRLKELLVERQMSFIDAIQAAGLEGLRPGSPEWQQAINQASQIDDKEIKDILGPDAEATLADLKSNAGKAQAQPAMQAQVNTMTSDFVDAGVPLTADQSAGLTQALLSAWYWQGKDVSDRPADYNDPDPNTGLSAHDVRNLSNAAQVLTPDQLAVLQNYEIEMQRIRAIQRQYRIPPGG